MGYTGLVQMGKGVGLFPHMNNGGSTFSESIYTEWILFSLIFMYYFFTLDTICAIAGYKNQLIEIV